MNQRNRIILISKDVLMRGYLPVYGNKYNKTPNIDELSEKGTVFNRHYTAAPSTAMAFTSMFTGLYAYETDRKKYIEVSDWQGDTFFDKMAQRGYDCHIVWDKSYVYLAQRYSKCYGRNSKFHNTEFLTRSQPAHIKGRHDDMSFDAALEEECITKMQELTEEIVNGSEKIFMWVHFPHALLGRNAYGSDIDMLDRMIGMFRQYFNDDSIYITADHGHMNGSHGKYGYGFDVYENAIQIPLITPRIDGMKTVDFATSNIQLGDSIQGKVEKHDIIYSETAYYMQPHRKIAIIKGRFKYIYEKLTGKEFLFDIEWDKDENINLLDTEIYDTDRNRSYSLTQRFFYPYWTEINNTFNELRNEKNRIWKNAPFPTEIKEKILFRLKKLYMKFK